MMIQLSGLVAAGDDREADIEIVEIGLRPGEKIHEELLIDNRGLPTSHPRIVKASESGEVHSSFEARFGELLKCMESRDISAALSVIDEMIARKAPPATGRGRQRVSPKASTAAPRRHRRAQRPVTSRQAFES
jgi:FlaA1/EpsC-like NDP-sugar epimerase